MGKVFNVIALFPKTYDHYLNHSIIKRARKANAVQFNIIPLREAKKTFFSSFNKACVDDTPYGGGGGMVIMAPPLIDRLKDYSSTHTILLTPRGTRLTQKRVIELSNSKKDITIVYGHYEGIDERICEMGLIDEELSIGDFVLTSGELPALMLIDSITRLLPEVINPKSLKNESFTSPDRPNEYCPLLDSPVYTKPHTIETANGTYSVPEILKSGNDAKITEYRLAERKRITKEKRPDLYKEFELFMKHMADAPPKPVEELISPESTKKSESVKKSTKLPKKFSFFNLFRPLKKDVEEPSTIKSSKPVSPKTKKASKKPEPTKKQETTSPPKTKPVKLTKELKVSKKPSVSKAKKTNLKTKTSAPN